MKSKLRTTLVAAGALFLAGNVLHAQSTMTINVDAAKTGAPINPRMYGIFLEEINHGVDGGLYGEMLQNRGFEDAKAPEGFTYQTGGGRRGSGFRGADPNGGKWVNPGGYATTFIWDADKSLPYWSLVRSPQGDGGAAGAMSLDMANPLNAQTPRSCKLEITAVPDGGRVGIANEGYWGVGIKEGEKYNLSFFARCAPGFAGNLSASLENGNKVESDVIKIDGITSDWKQYHATLTANASDGKAKFVLAADAKGTIWLDMVSLFPAKTFKDRPNGLRQDIAQMIADLKPGFVRFPGGCVVEAATVETAYNWKNTIGPVEQRPEVWNAWDYRRTHGMGLYEYLQFIEDIGAKPMYVAFAGQTCIYRSPAVVPMEQMQPIVDSYPDIVEYANGSPESKWGKLRAEAGHAAPFGLNLIEIGNENTDMRGQPVYSSRYSMIFNALKQKYPDVQTIADLPMRQQKIEMVDEHHYADPNWFFNNGHLYDNVNRQVPLYLGEVAVTSGPGVPPERGSLQAALAEGTYLMGAERNADVVKMVSYAPLLANVDGRTALAGAPPPWHGMIYFDSTHTFGTVSYYLWKLFGTNRPTVNLQTSVAALNPSTGIVGNVGVGTWGTSAEFKDVKVEKDGKTLYASDFAKGTEGWSTDGGNWSVQDGAYRQARNVNGFSYIGDENWTDYTMTLKARKISGGEGFLIIFGHKGGDRYWWNIGGWGNTRHDVELNQAVVGRFVNASIDADKWYDIKLEVSGHEIKCYLDGALIHDVQATPPPGPLAAVAGRDDATGEIVIKAINRSPKSITATLNIAGIGAIDPSAKATLLTSAGLQDNNSLANPTKVVPVEKEITVSGTKFDQEFPAYSLSVLRLKAK